MSQQWITELMWAIELTITHERWRQAKNIQRLSGVDDDQFIRATWVRMCMRLGDEAALRILRAQQTGRKAVIVTSAEKHYEIIMSDAYTGKDKP